MKLKSFATTAGAAALALAMWITPGNVQGQPLYDRIKVNLPYKIVLGEKTLQPGDYTIQRLPDNGGARILLFYTDDGMKFETSAMTIPVLDINTARDTKVILTHVGDDYYINKIWVQGKDYGYEIPMPKSLKLRETEKMTQTSVTAQSVSTATETTKTETAENVEVDKDKATVTVPPPVTAETEVKTQETVAAVETPVPVATPTVDADANAANRDATETPAPTPAPTTMPATSANWLMMLLSGGTLSGAGMMLRRKR